LAFLVGSSAVLRFMPVAGDADFALAPPSAMDRLCCRGGSILLFTCWSRNARANDH
jgi:hypothetical protein